MVKTVPISEHPPVASELAAWLSGQVPLAYGVARRVLGNQSDAEDAVHGEDLHPHQRLGVLLGVDVVGDDGERQLVLQRPRQGRREGGLAGADRAADADLQRSVGSVFTESVLLCMMGYRLGMFARYRLRDQSEEGVAQARVDAPFRRCGYDHRELQSPELSNPPSRAELRLGAVDQL